MEKGQTLYSISKAYEVLISEIVFANPDAMNGIKPDQELRIPKKGIIKESAKLETQIQPEVDGNFLIHTVKPQETLYSLAKEYEIVLLPEIKYRRLHKKSRLSKCYKHMNLRALKLVYLAHHFSHLPLYV